MLHFLFKFFLNVVPLFIGGPGQSYCIMVAVDSSQFTLHGNERAGTLNLRAINNMQVCFCITSATDFFTIHDVVISQYRPLDPPPPTQISCARFYAFLSIFKGKK